MLYILQKSYFSIYVEKKYVVGALYTWVFWVYKFFYVWHKRCPKVLVNDVGP